MASGKPIIASDVGGIPELIYDGENGILVKPDDVNALSEAILKMSYDDYLRRKISQNALKTVVHARKIAKRYVSLYEYMMEKDYHQR